MINTKTKKRKYYILVVLLLTVLAVLILPNLIVSSIQNVTKETAQKLNSFSMSQISSAYISHPHVSIQEISQITMYRTPDIMTNTMLETAVASGQEYYCSQLNTSFGRLRHKVLEGEKVISIAAGQNYGSISNNGWKNYSPTRGYYQNFENNGVSTNPRLRCVGHHNNYAQAGGEYYPDAAYILTYPTIGSFTPEKQRALWNTAVNKGKPVSNFPTAQPNALYNEAVCYQDFHNKITGGGNNLSNPSINSQDHTQNDSVKVKANASNKTYSIGPYSIDYISGAYSPAFGGISDMYMKGYNAWGQEVRSRINVKQYIDANNTVHGLSYFNPNTSDSSYVDRGTQSYPRGRSAGESTFSVVIDDPNAGVTNPTNYVAYVELHVEFKWMAVTKAVACEAQGEYWVVEWQPIRTVHSCIHTTCGPECYHEETHCVHTHSYANGCFDKVNGSLICTHKCTWASGCKQNVHKCTHQCNNYCYLYYAHSRLNRVDAQDHIAILEGERKLFSGSLTVGTRFKIPMQLGGYVWEDVPTGKENLADGKKTNLDRALPNIKVTLYKQNGQIAQLMENPAENGLSNTQIIGRVNPTYTNSAGYYLFEGVDPMEKYYVQFEYNGQTYLPTEYERNLNTYNTKAWEITSKGTETPKQRDNYDKVFAEIGSSPANYKVPTGAMQIATLVNGYNESYSQYQLMGFEMTENGDYQQGVRLIDSFYQIENGNITETNTLQEGVISKAIKNYIITNKRSPSSSDMLNIYKQIANGDQEILKKLQFIEDTKMHSYTQAQSATVRDMYPVYNAYIINNGRNNRIDMGGGTTVYYDNSYSTSVGGTNHSPIYPGQYYINQGLWRRQEVDLALSKDVLYAATRINGKTEVYTYNTRNEYTEEQKAELRRLRQIYEQNGRKPADYQAYLAKKAEFEEANQKNYWEIQLRMRDYNNYYQQNYIRELYQADFNYRSDATNKAGQDKELQLYVTYKITVRNNSMSILNEVTEIVDYYDKDYTYRDDLSWVMYKKDSNSNDLAEINFTEADYYDTINNLALNTNISQNNKGTKSATTGQYETRSSTCKSDMANDYNELYINGLAGKKLAAGEEAYVYLTFQVNKDGDKPVIIDSDTSLKQNYAELNGYKTYYKDGTKLPNNITKGSNDAAGLIDRNSTPGNLCKNDLVGNKFEQNLENDTDRAKSIKITIDNDYIRSINGNVWEDQRTSTVADAVIGDGVRQDQEIGITGAKVELVERLEDGSEYIWQTTTTQNGKYEFKTDENNEIYIIPGNYFIRFSYGHNKETVNTTDNGGNNKTSYNGQDFKSTVYQKNMSNENEPSEYTGMKIQDYDGTYQGNDVGYYDIRQSDNFATNGAQLSDAKDLWTRRQEVIQYSNGNITNEKAEILASPYTTGNTQELIDNTNMTAITGLIVLEGEYNRTDTQGITATSNGASEYQYGNDHNGSYTLNNVDLGLVERPKAALELGKKITNVKVTLANGNILFDANNAMTDLIWLQGTPYALNTVGIQNGKYQEFYGADNHRYTYRTERGTADYSVNELVASKYANNGNNGIITAHMDKELMQGANISITYEMTVTNVGETDYEGQDFYYKGTGTDNIVTTNAEVVTDYVANNLTFKEENNQGTGWGIVSNSMTTLGLNNTLATKVAQYNNIVKTENLSKDLKPTENTKVGLVLTQLLNPESSDDDKTYDNIAEITTISNTVGRRMAYSIQGNQDPTAQPAEVDSVKSERVTILPPFGIGNTIVYIAVAATVLVILAGGIIFIKKKVLKNK